jgi:hypothetical protein
MLHWLSIAVAALAIIFAPVVEIGAAALIFVAGASLWQRSRKWPGAARVASRTVAAVLIGVGGVAAVALTLLWAISRWPNVS